MPWNEVVITVHEHQELESESGLRAAIGLLTELVASFGRG